MTDPDLPERPLWDWLDAAGVPFRDTVDRIVGAYGLSARAAATWTETVCRLPQVPAQLVASSGLWIRPDIAGPPAPPQTFSATWAGRALRMSRYRSTREALSGALGAAEEETSPRYDGSRELRARWRHGAAGVDLVCITESGVRVLLGGAASLYVTISTAVVPELSDTEVDVVARSQLVDPGVPTHDVGPGTGAVPGLWRRDSLGLSSGEVWVDDATRTLTFVTDDRLIYVPPDWVSCVRLQNVPVGKAGDASYVCLMHGESRLASLWSAPRVHALDAAAAALAERLGVPLASEMLPAG